MSRFFAVYRYAAHPGSRRPARHGLIIASHDAHARAPTQKTKMHKQALESILNAFSLPFRNPDNIPQGTSEHHAGSCRERH